MSVLPDRQSECAIKSRETRTRIRQCCELSYHCTHVMSVNGKTRELKPAGLMRRCLGETVAVRELDTPHLVG